MKTAETDGTIIEFLLGSHPYDGVWFGDQHPEKEGWFWWRKALRDYASHPSPMSAEPTVQQLRDVSKNNPDTFIAGALYVIDNYKLNSPPMSAEQVEELADKYASEEFDKHSFSEFKGAENSLWENRKADFIAGYNAATTPSVKADGWVSVDKEKEFHKVLKCLKNNKVMVGTREDGIYIRLAGRESEGEAFTLHFALAYPFPKLPPHQNKNK